jgi:hypothetical protein
MTDRAVSETLGFVVIFSLVLLTTTVASVGGVQSLQDTRQFQQVENTERAFEILASNMAEIHDGGAPSRATEVTVAQGSLRFGDTTTLNVTVDDGASTSNRTYDVTPVVYESASDHQLVYAGGAVFRTDGDGDDDGVVVRDPPMKFHDDRVLASAVATTATNPGRSVGSTTVLVRAESTGTNVSLSDRDGTYDDVWVNVTSERAHLWQDYLERTAMEDCTTGTDADGDEFVECHLDAAPETVYLSADFVDVEFET